LTDLGLNTALDLLGKAENEQAVVGDFWGANLRELSPTSAQVPDPLYNTDSEGHMDGVSCDVCHRMIDNQKDSSGVKAAGNGGLFVTVQEPFTAAEDDPGQIGAPDVMYSFQGESTQCGTCHEVTDPDGDGVPVNVAHPIERTYTEWYNSSFPGKANGRCQDCHRPMCFPSGEMLSVTL
jgi:hypothetical protein